MAFPHRSAYSSSWFQGRFFDAIFTKSKDIIWNGLLLFRVYYFLSYLSSLIPEDCMVSRQHFAIENGIGRSWPCSCNWTSHFDWLTEHHLAFLKRVRVRFTRKSCYGRHRCRLFRAIGNTKSSFKVRYKTSFNPFFPLALPWSSNVVFPNLVLQLHLKESAGEKQIDTKLIKRFLAAYHK